MKHVIELDHDQCDAITVGSLKEAYRANCIPDRIDCSNDTTWVDEDFLQAIELVMEYFCNAEQMQQWREEKALLVLTGREHAKS